MSCLVIFKLIEVILQPRNLFMRAELVVDFGFDLADALARDAEFGADFFERVLDAIMQAVAHFQNLALFRRKVVEHFANLVGQDATRRILIGAKDLVIGDEFAAS